VKKVEQKNSLQFFILACIIGVFLTIGSFLFSGITNAIINPDSVNHFKENTMIGPIKVSGLNKEQTKLLLAKETATWKNENKTDLQFIFEHSLIDSSIFKFDISNMVEIAKQEKQNSMTVSIDEDKWKDIVLKLGYIGTEEYIDWSTLKNDLLEQALHLEKISSPIHLTQYMIRNETGISELGSTSMSFPANDLSATSWVRKHGKLLIESDKQFSLNEIFTADPDGLYSDQFKTILASTIYKASLESPVQIIQRQTSVNNQFSIQDGFEAYVNKSNDFIIKNTYGYPLTLISTIEGNRFVVSIVGPLLGIEIKLDPLQRKVLPFRVQIQTIESTLPEKTDAGIEGVEVDVSRTLYVNGEKNQTYHVSKDLYFPLHEVQYRHEEIVGTSGEDSLPSNDSGGGTSIPGTNVPPGGTSTDLDPDHILEEDQKNTTK
jgi:hypothetical protein